MRRHYQLLTNHDPRHLVSAATSLPLPLLLLLLLPSLSTPARSAGPASAPDTTPRQTSSQSTAPTIQVYSRETVVDVIVTGADGKPVHGLQQSDFTVKEDGKEQPIRSFKETGAAVQAVSFPQPLPKLPPNVYTNLHASPASGPVSILLLDALHTPWDDMVYEKQAAIAYLKSMTPETEVAIFAWSGNNGLRLLQDFTSDGAAAAAQVNALDVSFDPEKPPLLFCHSPCSWSAAAVSPVDIKAKRLSTSNPVPMQVMDEVTGVMNHIAAYAAGIKGRKGLLWLASNIPFGCLTTTDQQLAEVFDGLTSAQVAIYPVDATGLKGMPLSAPGPITVRSGAAAANVAQNFVLARGCYQTLLEGVAEVTGGKALYNNNDLKSEIVQAVDHSSHYYTLTYVPPPFPNDARYHSIHIEVDRPGLRLTYRKGFDAEDPAKPAPGSGPALMKASMGGGVPPSTQLLFDVSVEPSTEEPGPFDPPVMGQLDPKFKKAPLTRYTCLFAVPVSQIAFADAPGALRNGSVEFDVAAFGSDGSLVSLQSQTMKLPLTGDEYQQFRQTPFRFFQQIDLPPGEFTLRVGILDGVSNKVGTLEAPLTVPKAPAQRATVRPAP